MISKLLIAKGNVFGEIDANDIDEYYRIDEIELDASMIVYKM